jgi:hypothetical protein
MSAALTAANSRRRPARSARKSAKPDPSLYDRIKHLCGVIAGPGDLSTNPKYM